MPCSGQSLTWPVGILSCVACQRNLPVFSSTQTMTPLSPSILGRRFPRLFVPTNTFPLEITGLPYVCDPSGATHLMFFFALTSHSWGIPVSPETMFRLSAPPHMGQSPFLALARGSDRAEATRPRVEATTVQIT